MRSKILENQVRSGQLSSGHVFGQQATSPRPVWKGGGLNVIVGCVPHLKQSFVTFDRGGQTGPPRSNDFFFGAADDTRAARTSARTSGQTPSRTPADDTGAADRKKKKILGLGSQAWVPINMREETRREEKRREEKRREEKRRDEMR